MKWKYVLTSTLVTMFVFNVNSQNSRKDQIIYKWIDGGLVYYSYIEPNNISNVTKLSPKGIKIKNYGSKDTFETMEKLPEKEQKTDTKSTPKELTTKQKNCKIAKSNLKKLQGESVYEKDEKGVFVRLKPEDIEIRKKNSQKDVDYFCTN